MLDKNTLSVIYDRLNDLAYQLSWNGYVDVALEDAMSKVNEELRKSN